MNDMSKLPRHEDLVRSRAYAIWESEGCPVGRDAAHWLQSEAEAERELVIQPAVAEKAKPAARKKGKRA